MGKQSKKKLGNTNKQDLALLQNELNALQVELEATQKLKVQINMHEKNLKPKQKKLNAIQSELVLLNETKQILLTKIEETSQSKMKKTVSAIRNSDSKSRSNENDQTLTANKATGP